MDLRRFFGSRTDDSDGVVILESESEEEAEAEVEVEVQENDPETALISPTRPQDERQSDIRTRIERARTLLEDAELLSRPRSNDLQNNNTNDISTNSSPSLNRYGISINVTARDFYRESELSSLCDVASVLKARLNVERIYNLGHPQCLEEREIFDELLVSHFSDLVSHESNPRPNIARDDSLSLRESIGISGLNDDNEQHSSTSNSNTGSTRDSLTLVNNSEDRGQSNNVVVPPGPESSSYSSNEATSFSSTSRVLDAVQNLRQYIAQNPQNIISNSETVNILSAFIQDLKKSPVLSSAVVSSPASTPSKAQLFSRKRQRSLDESCESNNGKGRDDGTDDEEECCSICLEPWTSGGEHRICCLKCGHIFGYSCITKWIKQAHSCPQCKTHAKKDDVRNLFSRKITAEDTSERDRALKLLEEEKVRSRSLEHKEGLARRNVETQCKLISSLEARITQMESFGSGHGRPEASDAVGACSAVMGSVVSSTSISTRQCLSSQSVDGTYRPLARVSITQDGNCRVFEYSKELGMVVVSTKSTNALFRGFGIKTLSRDFRVISYQPLHSALIRDMSFRPNTFDGTLLSCGMDKVIQLTSVTSKCVIQKFTMTGSGWCCAWNPNDNNLFYVGMERGLVKEFDIRRTDNHVQDVLDLGGAPIASVRYWDGHQSQIGRSTEGLLIAQLRNLIYREKNGSNFHTHFLPCSQAPMMGISLHSSGHFLTSFRPGASNHRCQYEVCRLVPGLGTNSINSTKVTAWEGSNLQAIISRNHLLSMPESDGRLLAATADHLANTVSLWDVDRQRASQVLTCHDKAIDIKPISVNQQDLLGVLSESELVLYKWR